MLWLFRILFPLGVALCLLQGAQSTTPGLAPADLQGLVYAVFALLFGLGTAAVWAPYVGEKIAEPLTAVLTSGAEVEGENQVIRLIHALLLRGWRRTALFVCLLESLWHPKSPAAPWLGLRHARPGSWLEREFAWMVYEFNNAQHCLEAYRALKRHGIKPRTHHDRMVVLFVQAYEQQPKPSGPPVDLPAAGPPPRLKRDPRIKLFEEDDEVMALSVAAREAAAAGQPKMLAEAPRTSDGAAVSKDSERPLPVGGWLSRLRMLFSR